MTRLLVTAAAVLVALFSSREASAHVSTTYIFFFNNTSSTIQFSGTSFSGSNDYWIPCDAAGFTSGSNPLFRRGPNPTKNGVNFVPNNVAGPPPTVAPGVVTCFEAVTDTALAGTGGTVPFTWTPPPPTGSSSTAGEPFGGEIIWSMPYESTHPMPPYWDPAGTPDNSCTAHIHACPGSFGNGCESWGSTADVFSLTGGVDGSGGDGPFEDHCSTAGDWRDYVTFQLDDVGPPTTNLVWSGYPGDTITINGANFDTTGLTSVFFGPLLSPSVTCSSSTTCTAAVPSDTGTIYVPGTVPLTVDVAGETAKVGTYSYLPIGPACTYSASQNEFKASCVGDTLNDPIWIYEWQGQAWEYVYSFPTGTSAVTPITGVQSPGATETFAACLSIDGFFPSPGTSSTNLPIGCDTTPTTVINPKHGEHGDG